MVSSCGQYNTSLLGDECGRNIGQIKELRTVKSYSVVPGLIRLAARFDRLFHAYSNYIKQVPTFPFHSVIDSVIFR